ncbi:alpha/beta fold hydrolase [Luteibacter aegosomatissinici]|uniref:alpha/beta fold hydrolase n=1 Tax=Luteibacter aegosomatissinici TaxID=2911539 RepID=UPI001FF9E535|nr:alpha/beta hydrolase [Luteibacter aegosomatissinici]UPG92707.1 alpha/beta hydrolase [Luteibacter aegosomatissinici]
MSRLFLGAAMLAATVLPPTSHAATRPTIVLVHGAFADSSSWNGVIGQLQKDGYTVVAAANPLRSVKGDAASVARVVGSIKGDVVLVGHSYGGSVITQAAEGQANVRALVYVAAFAPAVGESGMALSRKYPGSTLGPTLAPPVALASGGHDLFIEQAKFPAQFAADLPPKTAALMAAGQRPVTDTALNDAPTSAAWTHIPSWHIYGDADKCIPPAAMAFMAERAASKKTVVIKGASHVVMVSHPLEVAHVIEEAAAAK